MPGFLRWDDALPAGATCSLARASGPGSGVKVSPFPPIRASPSIGNVRPLRQRIFGRATLGEFLATREIRLALLALTVLAAAILARGCVERMA